MATRKTGKMLWQSESGQAIVETALAISLLILVIGAIVEFGRLFNTFLTVNYSAREGARVGALGRADIDIETAVRTAATGIGSKLQIVITPAQSFRTRGTSLEVAVTCPVDIIFPLMESIMPDPFPVNARVIMRVES